MGKNKPQIVERTPLIELWDDTGSVATARGRDLSADDVREWLRQGAVRFVVANIGEPLLWIPQSERFSFWKCELEPHLADPKDQWHLDDFPQGYCYVAREWQAEDGTAIVVLECHH